MMTTDISIAAICNGMLYWSISCKSAVYGTIRRHSQPVTSITLHTVFTDIDQRTDTEQMDYYVPIKAKTPIG